MPPPFPPPPGIDSPFTTGYHHQDKKIIHEEENPGTNPNHIPPKVPQFSYLLLQPLTDKIPSGQCGGILRKILLQCNMRQIRKRDFPLYVIIENHDLVMSLCWDYEERYNMEIQETEMASKLKKHSLLLKKRFRRAITYD